MVVKSYRGLLADGGQEKVRISCGDGRTGYRIIKLLVFPTTVGDVTQESVLSIFKEEIAAVPTSGATTDFTDGSLLGVAAFTVGSGTSSYQQSPSYSYVVFDNEIFNQDIYVTHTDNGGSNGLNYYIELEQIKLSPAQAEVLIVKDLRKQPWTRP